MITYFTIADEYESTENIKNSAQNFLKKIKEKYSTYKFYCHFTSNYFSAEIYEKTKWWKSDILHAIIFADAKTLKIFTKEAHDLAAEILESEKIKHE